MASKNPVLQNRAGISVVSFCSRPCSIRRLEGASRRAALLARTHRDISDSQACCSPAAGCQTMADAAPACPSLDAKWGHLLSLQSSLIQFVIRPIPAALMFISNQRFSQNEPKLVFLKIKAVYIF